MAAPDTLHVILAGTQAAIAAAAEVDPEPVSKAILLGAGGVVALLESLAQGPDPAKAIADLQLAIASLPPSTRHAADAADLAARETKP